MIAKSVICLFVFVQYISYGSCIQCYECSSAENSMCLDPTIYDKETVEKYLQVTDCNALPLGQKYFCRKIVQTILHKNHDSEVRVTRGCGYVPHRRDCYKADNEDHLETVCQCFTDHCNAAARTAAAAALVVAGLCRLML